MEKQAPKNESFSLAGTFPHTVRFGKKKIKGPGPTVSSPQKGDTEAAPQVEEAEAQGDRIDLPTRGPNEGKRDPRDPRPDRESKRDPRDPRSEKEDYCKWKSPDYAVHLLNVISVGSEAGTIGTINEQPTAEDLDHAPTNGTIQQRTYDNYDSKGQRRGTLYHDYFLDEGLGEGLPQNEKPFNYWAVVRLHLQRPLAEWLGTTVFMFIGISGNLSVITSDYQTGTMQSMYWCWGFAVMLAIYIAGGGSGAFLNPALTLMLSVFRGFPAKRVPLYIFVQLLGAFTGAILAFAVYRDDIIHLDGGLIPESTGMAFYTQPKDWVSNSTAFFTEMLGTAVIGCSILALGDSHNSPPGAGMHAFIIGLLTTAVTMSLGYSTGGCFNPVRDLGPRLATIVAGYPSSAFTAKQNWWIWGPWCATITGALLGGLIYDLCIFKGGESPVNYSFGRWQIEGIKEGANVARHLGLTKQKESLEKKLEEGGIHDDPKI